MDRRAIYPYETYNRKMYNPGNSYSGKRQSFDNRNENCVYEPYNTVRPECQDLYSIDGQYQTNHLNDGAYSSCYKMSCASTRAASSHSTTEYHFTVNGKVSINPAVHDYRQMKPSINGFFSSGEMKSNPMTEIRRSEIHSCEQKFVKCEPEEAQDMSTGFVPKSEVEDCNETKPEKNTNTIQGEKCSDDISEKTSNSEVKPAMSYIALIGKAILESSQKRLNLAAIYGWIEKTFPYYVNRGQGWRNSVRHNLSLNDCFIKAGRCEDGKGNYWAIHPANLQDFMQGDFRQRRRCRKRGSKREPDMNLYINDHPSSTMPVPTAFPNLGMNTGLSPIYSPYTEAERRAYKLDEALSQQGINNHLWHWMNNNNYPNLNTPVSVNSGNYTASSNHWTHYQGIHSTDKYYV